MGGQENVTLYDPDSKDDIAKGLITQGLILVELRKEKRFAKLISEYAKAQEKAKANRVRYTTQNLIIRDYHMGILVIARSINPRSHYQARER